MVLLDGAEVPVGIGQHERRPKMRSLPPVTRCDHNETIHARARGRAPRWDRLAADFVFCLALADRGRAGGRWSDGRRAAELWPPSYGRRAMGSSPIAPARRSAWHGRSRRGSRAGRIIMFTSRRLRRHGSIRSSVGSLGPESGSGKVFIPPSGNLKPISALSSIGTTKIPGPSNGPNLPIKS